MKRRRGEGGEGDSDNVSDEGGVRLDPPTSDVGLGSLRRLPPEIRRCIYQFYFQDRRVIQYYDDSFRKDTSLLLSSKAI